MILIDVIFKKKTKKQKQKKQNSRICKCQTLLKTTDYTFLAKFYWIFAEFRPTEDKLSQKKEGVFREDIHFGFICQIITCFN